jgi:hypothetical protein
MGKVSKTMREVEQKMNRWKKEGANSLEKREETGGVCVIDEQHILIWNGWKHV